MEIGIALICVIVVLIVFGRACRRTNSPEGILIRTIDALPDGEYELMFPASDGTWWLAPVIESDENYCVSEAELPKDSTGKLKTRVLKVGGEVV